MHKKKKDEFIEFMKSKKRKIIILQGPPGCGKNAMINAYAKENGFDVVRYEHHSNLRSILQDDVRFHKGQYQV